MKNNTNSAVSRRKLLKIGGALGGSAMLSGGGVTKAWAKGGADDPVIPPPVIVSPPITPFVEALPIIPIKEECIEEYGRELEPPATETTCDGELVRDPHQRWPEFQPEKFYEQHVVEFQHSFHPEIPPQSVWGFDGMIPGPTFVAKYGKPILVRRYNDLPAGHTGFGVPEISTHLHNLHSHSQSDGFPLFFFGPGVFKDYHYPNCLAGYDTIFSGDSDSDKGDPREALGTLWYHDHRVDHTAENVYKGLAGFHLMFDEIDTGDETDSDPRALRLPGDEFDVPLMFMDIRFDSSQPGYPVHFDFFNLDGLIGDRFLVNGKIQPYFNVQARKYRFRLLDAGPSRFYEFWLQKENGQFVPFDYYLANDGNLLVRRL
jgi:FtsP/CotA-like multicopper oxidase with cupredoxin domain